MYKIIFSYITTPNIFNKYDFNIYSDALNMFNILKKEQTIIKLEFFKINEEWELLNSIERNHRKSDHRN